MTQCKDIPTEPILRFLAGFPDRRCNWFGVEYDNAVQHAMPPETPDKVVLAKMRQLIKRGLVDGCPCGCRGDFELTEKGREALRADTPTTGVEP